MMSQPMRIDRPKSKSDYTVLKQASKSLVRSCGGLEAAALVTRVGHSELARYYDPTEKLFMPIDVAADLEAIARSPLVTQSLASMMDFALIPVHPQTNAEPDNHWTVLLAHLGGETAAALRQIGSALSEHGTLTADSIDNFQLTRHLDNMIQAAMQLKASIAQRQGRALQYRTNSQRPDKTPLS
jgi:hypothetical protein